MSGFTQLKPMFFKGQPWLAQVVTPPSDAHVQWSDVYTDIKSLCCIPETNKMLFVNCTSIKEKEFGALL